MLPDISIDTNVWAHADNPQEPRQADSVALLSGLLGTTTSLCVDPEFSLVEASNRSKIGSEYLTHLAALPLASATLATLASSGRVQFVPTQVPDAVRRLINRLVGDPSDRIFVKVAHNSRSGVLCSHDFTHLPHNARAQLQRHGVDVLAADQALVRL